MALERLPAIFTATQLGPRGPTLNFVVVAAKLNARPVNPDPTEAVSPGTKGQAAHAGDTSHRRLSRPSVSHLGLKDPHSAAPPVDHVGQEPGHPAICAKIS